MIDTDLVPVAVEVDQQLSVRGLGQSAETLPADLQQQLDIVSCGEPHLFHELHPTRPQPSVLGHQWRGQEKNIACRHLAQLLLTTGQKPAKDIDYHQILDFGIDRIGYIIF